MSFMYRLGYKDDPETKVYKYNELSRIIFNLQCRQDRLMGLVKNCNANGLRIRSDIQNYLENNEEASAKLETKKLVESNYERISLTIVLKKVTSVMECLKTYSKNLDLFDSQLMKVLNKVDRAIRTENLKNMDRVLTKLKSYLDPYSQAEELGFRSAILQTNKEAEERRLFEEIKDEVFLVKKLAGVSVEKNFINYHQAKRTLRKQKKLLSRKK